MSAPFEPSTLIGRCACGAALTAWHLQFSCPLNRQQASDALQAAFVNHAYEWWWKDRLDTSHVAVLGEN